MLDCGHALIEEATLLASLCASIKPFSITKTTGLLRCHFRWLLVPGRYFRLLCNKAPRNSLQPAASLFHVSGDMLCKIAGVL